MRYQPQGIWSITPPPKNLSKSVYVILFPSRAEFDLVKLTRQVDFVEFDAVLVVISEVHQEY